VKTLTTSSTEAYRHYIAGLIAQESLRSQDAMREFEFAIAADSTFAQAYAGISKIYYSTLQGLGESRDLARHFAQLAWNHRSGLGVKDRLLLDAWRHHVLGRIQSSLDVYEELSIRYPDDTRIIKDYVVKLSWSWYHDQALDLAQQGLTILPEDFLLGVINTSALRCIGRLEDGVNACRTLTRIHPDEPNAWDELGLTQLARGKPDSAEVAFESALKLDPLFEASLYGLAVCDYSRGDLTGAISRVEALTTRSNVPDGVRLQYLVNWNELGLVALLADAGRCREALVACDAAHELAGTDGRNQQKPVLSLSLVRLQMRDFTGTLEELAEAERLRGGQANTAIEWCYAKFKALIALGRFSQADSVLSQVRSGAANGAIKFTVLEHILSAELALAKDDPAEALSQLEPVSRFRFGWHPWSIDIWMKIARAHRMAGRPSEAEAEFMDLLGIYGGHAIAHYELGQLYEEMNRAEDALTEYSRFLDLWANADENMPQLNDARRRVITLKARI
jgi:tetratricopeptide (TPR) repeat protein